MYVSQGGTNERGMDIAIPATISSVTTAACKLTPYIVQQIITKIAKKKRTLLMYTNTQMISSSTRNFTTVNNENKIYDLTITCKC